MVVETPAVAITRQIFLKGFDQDRRGGTRGMGSGSAEPQLCAEEANPLTSHHIPRPLPSPGKSGAGKWGKLVR
jgi:hypothetical protein